MTASERRRVFDVVEINSGRPHRGEEHRLKLACGRQVCVTKEGAGLKPGTTKTEREKNGSEDPPLRKEKTGTARGTG